MCQGCNKSRMSVSRGPWEKWWAWHPVKIETFWYWREWVIRSHWIHDTCEMSVGGWTYDVVTNWSKKRSNANKAKKVGWWARFCMKVLGSKK